MDGVGGGGLWMKGGVLTRSKLETRELIDIAAAVVVSSSTDGQIIQIIHRTLKISSENFEIYQ